MADAPLAHELAQAAEHLRAAKMFQLASFVFLVYDHLLCFADEVERIWKNGWSWVTALYVVNRYVTPLQFLIIIVAFHSEAWFVKFEGGTTLVMVAVCEVMMMMRVYALWGCDRRILAVLTFLLLLQIAGSALALSFSKRAPLPPNFVGCILAGKNVLLLPIWVMPLITDTVIFGLTLWRTKQYMAFDTSMPLLRLLIRDGTAYFFCIFAANLMNSVFFLAATDSLKAIGASFSQMITSVMISRLVLNLRGLRDGGGNDTDATAAMSTTEILGGKPVDILARNRRRRAQESIPMSTLENYTSDGQCAPTDIGTV